MAVEQQEEPPEPSGARVALAWLCVLAVLGLIVAGMPLALLMLKAGSRRASLSQAARWAEAARKELAHGNASGAEGWLQLALQEDPHSVDAHTQRGVLAGLRNESDGGEAHFRRAIEELLAAGRSPAHFSMNLEGGERRYRESLTDEARQFAEVSADAAAGSTNLAGALREIRETENDTEWLLAWRLETHRVFGYASDSAAYGALWFPAFRQLLDQAPVAEALARQRLVRPPRRIAVVGSALGEQCLFAAAVGWRCVGHELLCGSMVDRARAIAVHHGLEDWVEFRCEPVSSLSSTALLVVNDLTWPDGVRGEIQELAERELPEGALFVSYRPPLGLAGAVARGNASEGASAGGRSLPTLEFLEQFAVRTSWSAGQAVYVHRRTTKNPPVAPAAPAVPAAPASAGGQEL